jgi:hypothetical protein
MLDALPDLSDLLAAEAPAAPQFQGAGQLGEVPALRTDLAQPRTGGVSMMELEIGSRLLAAIVVTGVVVLVLGWWHFASMNVTGRR